VAAGVVVDVVVVVVVVASVFYFLFLSLPSFPCSLSRFLSLSQSFPFSLFVGLVEDAPHRAMPRRGKKW